MRTPFLISSAFIAGALAANVALIFHERNVKPAPISIPKPSFTESRVSLAASNAYMSGFVDGIQLLGLAMKENLSAEAAAGVGAGMIEHFCRTNKIHP